MAVEGKLVDPAGIGSGGELGVTRSRLSRALSGGTRLGSPDLAAIRGSGPARRSGSRCAASRDRA